MVILLRQEQNDAQVGCQQRRPRKNCRYYERIASTTISPLDSRTNTNEKLLMQPANLFPLDQANCEFLRIFPNGHAKDKGDIQPRN